MYKNSRRVRISEILEIRDVNSAEVDVFCDESVQQLSVEEEEKFSGVLFCEEEECRVALEETLPKFIEELQNEVSCVVQDSVVVDVRENLDSAASANMSGVLGRISDSAKPQANIRINGFNNAGSMVNSVGVNSDGRKEYFVRDMPSNLALLCANDYAQIGAVVLLPESGSIIKLNELEKSAFLSFIEQFSVYLQLKVENRTYEVCRTSCDESECVQKVELLHAESAHSGTATRYFNSKVNITNSEERILAALLTGLSFNDLYLMIKFNSAEGLPRDITVQSLNNFEHKYGRTPSVLQMALPNLAGNTKGYMAQPPRVAKIGERVEADFFVGEFNEDSLSSATEDSNSRKQSAKLASHGGATAGFVDVDVYSGYLNGELAKSVANSVDFVRNTVSTYERFHHEIVLFAADQGILTQSHFRVFMPAARKYLESKGIRTECSEAYTHDHGTSHVERAIRAIKEKIRFAVLYLFNNPNFVYLGFTKTQILQLWGDLFYWALHVINLQPCVNVPEKTKYELFHGRKPDLRSIRLLPIFSVLYVLRQASAKQDLPSNRKFWQRGLYVGPSDQTPGAIRVAVVTKGKLKIIVTTNFKSVSDGGDINIHHIVDKVVRNDLIPVLISDKTENNTIPDVICAENSVNVDDSSSNSDAEVVDSSSELRGGDSVPDVYDDGSVLTLPKMPKKIRKSKKEKLRLRLLRENLSTDYLSTDKYAANVKSHGSREDRMAKRAADKVVAVNSVALSVSGLLDFVEEANFVDWSTHHENAYYLDLVSGIYFQFDNMSSEDCANLVEEDGFRAVTEGVPKSFTAALKDGVWGDPARTELQVVTTLTGAIVAVDQEIAKSHIAGGSEVLRMLTVYEEKIKEGVLVRKVRLVCDGRKHTKHGNIYSPTPSREEFLILMHYFAVHNYNFYAIDEIRAFLNAPKQDQNRVFTKFQGNPDYFEIIKSVYGQKDASRNYQDEVARRMKSLGFERLHMCSCIYVKIVDGHVLLVYDYVDDFVCGCRDDAETLKFITEYRN